jgi:excisionase family DNA binding protein
MPETPATPRASLTRLMNITEVAETLGVDVRHVRRLVHENRIPYLKWGHLLRFDPAEVAAWLDSCRHRGGVTAARPDH